MAELDPEVSAVDREDLALLVRTYLLALGPSAAQISAVVQLYVALKKAATDGLVDGVGQRPCFRFMNSSLPFFLSLHFSGNFPMPKAVYIFFCSVL